ncbi:MAG: transcription antitermination factor NusB [Pseudomonadota bacterium]
MPADRMPKKDHPPNRAVVRSSQNTIEKDRKVSSGQQKNQRAPFENRNKKGGDRKSDHQTKIAGLDARRAAIDLTQMVEDGHLLDDALSFCKAFGLLEGPDRSFARALASTILRRRGSIDAVLDDYIDRPFPKKARRAMHILRCAAAQSLFLETPAHAVVSTAVEIAKEYQETRGFSGVINAIARRIAEKGPGALSTLPERVDTPAWLWRSWERHYGPAVTKGLAAAHRNEAAVDLTLKNPTQALEWAHRLNGTVIGKETVRLLDAPQITKLEGYSDGAWWVQDVAASMPARLLLDAIGSLSEKTVYDLCAAPGGKTMQLAAQGANVTAVDASRRRLHRLRDNLERLALKASIAECNLAEFHPSEPADAVLLDAPCSATGTIRRHPDILWSKTQEQVVDLAATQRQMVNASLKWLKPGGLLVYCVCSLQPEEGERQVNEILKENPELALVPIEPDTMEAMAGEKLRSLATKDGYLRTLPSHLSGLRGMDGFFCARFVKNQ